MIQQKHFIVCVVFYILIICEIVFNNFFSIFLALCFHLLHFMRINTVVKFFLTHNRTKICLSLSLICISSGESWENKTLYRKLFS